MRFIYVTDTHFNDKNPVGRKGNYLDDGMKKLRWVIDKYQEFQCDCIIHGGDLLEKHNPSYMCLLEIVDIIGDTNWIQILGNHDIVGGNKSSYRYSAIGVLGRIPKFIIDDVVEFEDCIVVCDHYYMGIDSVTKFNYDHGKTLIYAAHSMVVERPDKPFKSTCYKDIETNADYFLCSHYHPGFKSDTVGKTTFLAPGSLMRVKRGKTSDRRPAIYFVDTKQRIHFKISYKDATKYNDLFYEEEIKEEEYIISDKIEFEAIPDEQRIDKYCDKNNVSNKTRIFCHEVLSEI